ncbi:acyl-CoA Delta-9 desaturase-like [Cydia strobilella]|uniref:acyl-CoA Delta-9 desaturase-like n=1 Tax=Cydia strobilella TaxID=1100964 RepID=UPI003004D093
MSAATKTKTTHIEPPEFMKNLTQCRVCHVIHKSIEGIECDNNNNNIETTEALINEQYGSDQPLRRIPEFSWLRRWEQRMGFETELIWLNIIAISVLHIITVVWFAYNLMTGHFPKWQSAVYGYFVGNVAGFGVTAGVHRYWCHRSYKATLPLQWILIICYSVAGQNPIPEWVRDHRVHHKFSETSADPHDARRGFFFAHVGWLMMRKHPDVVREGRKIDMSDVSQDSLVQFHTKHFKLFKTAFCFVLPTLVPVWGWAESWEYAVLSQVFLRYLMSLNFTWAVNSFAHLWGNKPYDPNITPVENWGVSAVALGEGWHNYHHTFPWDYKAAELGYSLNFTTLLLDGFAKIGWAHNLKQASPQLIKAVVERKHKH